MSEPVLTSYIRGMINGSEHELVAAHIDELTHLCSSVIKKQLLLNTIFIDKHIFVEK